MRALLAPLGLAALAAAGQTNVVLRPPAGAKGPAKLLVWVPGGNVPNTAYEPVMQQMQADLSDSMQLWVSIAACLGKLCIPIITTTRDVTKALDNGKKQSGVSDAADVWVGGHSLGGVAADSYCAKKGGKSVGGGCVLWGAYAGAGPAGLASYPVPLLQLVAELDYGSARVTKMAPYYAAAAASAAQLARTPVVVQPGIDHSDFDAHQPDVPGDLPSSVAPTNALKAIASTTAEFMRQRIAGAAPSAEWGALLAASKAFFDPVNAALALERGGGWCAAVQKSIAGDLAPQLDVAASVPGGDDWPAPTAAARGGRVSVTVSGRNTYEGAWPPGAAATEAQLQKGAPLRAGAGAPPAVKRNTALPAGCRMVSRAKVAALLGKAAAAEPGGACEAANRAAWAWALARAPAAVLRRYNSSAPCSGCARAVPLRFDNDSAAADVSSLALDYDLSAFSLTVGSAALVSADEHSCALLGPSRALDFLYFDAYSASVYAAPASDATVVAPPADETKSPAVFVFVGRMDAPVGAYGSLLTGVQRAAAADGLSLWLVTGTDFAAVAADVAALSAAHPAARVFYAAHSMTSVARGDGGGGGAAHAALADPRAAGVVLIAGFLERFRRPGFAACAAKWGAARPTHDCPDGKGLPLCPGGYLPDGAHDCAAAGVPAPEYKLPTLSIAGTLDGVVRVARLAEAWYTQRGTPQHEVAVVDGMNHADVMDDAPQAVAQLDLESELGAAAAQEKVVALVAAFLRRPGKSGAPSPAAYFAPFEAMFVGEEGSWWWTTNSDESGSSPWAAAATPKLAAPAPDGYAWGAVTNAFHLLSDEDGIPPYYRAKHRPNVTVTGSTLSASTVAQLRYTEISVTQTDIGENGYKIIEEEKAALLNSVRDDGGDYVSAIEIATKIVSRQLTYNRTGAASPDSLDDGARCKDINAAAYGLALASASAAARRRFNATGRPLAFGADAKPTIPAGPWWIWTYLLYKDEVADMKVRSYYAFFPLDANPYGAGNHYCKLLSPARALEWVYTDGLRPPPSLSCCGKKGLLPCGTGILGRPVHISIDKQDYCCPKGATQAAPCPP